MVKLGMTLLYQGEVLHSMEASCVINGSVAMRIQSVHKAASVSSCSHCSENLLNSFFDVACKRKNFDEIRLVVTNTDAQTH